jgi:hypothetical protein
LKNRGPHITTASGKRFYPLDPQPDDICIEDIAHHLARICRFTGAVQASDFNGSFYSVAEHSVFMALCAPVQHRVAALLHDAAEAYFNDMARPIKYLPEMAPYRALIARTEAVIAEKFKFEYPLPEIVKDLDSRIILDERDQFLPNADWSEDDLELCEVGAEPLGVTLRGWLPEAAEAAFMEIFWTLGERGRRQ